MTPTVAIGCGAGFSGDRTDAPIAVVNALSERTDPEFLNLETLGARTLADAQMARRRDRSSGFEPLLTELLSPILADCLRHGIRIVSNCGAANPMAAGLLIDTLSKDLGTPRPKVAVVLGDDQSKDLATLTRNPWEVNWPTELCRSNRLLQPLPI